MDSGFNLVDLLHTQSYKRVISVSTTFSGLRRGREQLRHRRLLRPRRLPHGQGQLRAGGGGGRHQRGRPQQDQVLHRRGGAGAV